MNRLTWALLLLSGCAAAHHDSAGNDSGVDATDGSTLDAGRDDSSTSDSATGDSATGSNLLSQQVVWPIAGQANLLGNNLQIYVQNLYGFPTPGNVTYADVHALALALDGTLHALAKGQCSQDPQLGDAATATDAVVSFMEGLPMGAGNPSQLSAQEALEQKLAAATKAALAASTCAAQYSPEGIGSPPQGQLLLGTVVQETTSQMTTTGDVVLTPSGSFPAVGIAVTAGSRFTFAEIDIEYADGTSRSIPYGSVMLEPGWTMGAGIAVGYAMTIDIDARPLTKITLAKPSLDLTPCEHPSPGDGGAGGTCSTSVAVSGLAQGNGLGP
jgi:hypothetical protein